MTTEKQRIAIAEACGWVREYAAVPTWNAKLNNYKGDYEQVRTTLFRRAGKCVRVDSLPDYLNDLNAIHEMEEVLAQLGKENDYWFFLRTRIGFSEAQCDWDEVDYFAAVHATAAQRAEAFLRTIGKWEESS